MIDVTLKSRIKRFIYRSIIGWLIAVPFIAVLCVWSIALKPQYDYEECDNVLRYELIAFLLRAVLWFFCFFIIFAYFDAICLRFKLYDRAPTLDFERTSELAPEISTRTLDYRGSLLSRTDNTLDGSNLLLFDR